MQNLKVNHASSMSNGYGHKKINVELEYNGDVMNFTSVTNNMSDFDMADDLEGEERYNALYELISNSIADEVCEWLSDLTMKNL